MVLYGVSLKPSTCENAYQHVTRLETYNNGINQSTHDFIASRAGSKCRHRQQDEIFVPNCPIHGGSGSGQKLMRPSTKKSRRRQGSKQKKSTKRRGHRSRSKRRKSKSRKRSKRKRRSRLRV